MSSFRILHVVPYYEQAWAYGGIPRLATTLTRTLARRGHRVTVCTTDARDAVSRVARLATLTPSEPAAPHAVDIRMFRNLSNHAAYHWQLFMPMGLAAHLRDTAANFDVAHLHACHNVLGTIAARALSRAGVPYVLAPNGTATPIERRIQAKRLFATTLGRDVLPRAARLIAVTETERIQFAALGAPPAKIVVVPNPVDGREFNNAPDGASFRSAHRLGDANVVLFLGKLTPRKGVEHLVRAFAALADPRARLVIAGNDMGAGSSIDAAIQALGLAHRVLRTGLLMDRDRLDALSAADVVVYPSRDEIFGLVPLESLLCGTPVVVCDDSGCGEIISTIGGGLAVPFGDQAALAEAIRSILASPSLWQGEVRRASERALARYEADHVCRQLEAVYAEVVAESVGRDAAEPTRTRRHRQMA